ncbi:MAG: OmpA family protein [Flavobacteriaceae bacterium]|nr:OmpA family protein [Flavobacteriaceae bacterium]
MSKFWIIILLLSGAVYAQNETKFSLYYAHDEYELTENHHQLLDSLKSLQNKDSLDVHIKGYTNSIGGEIYNLELSRKRAENVKSELREFTIISTTGYGEIKSEAAAHRRVDILVHEKKYHIAVPGEIIEPPSMHRVQEPSIASILVPVKGEKVTLPGIMFYPDHDVIMDESKDALADLVDFLKKNPKVKFKLIGHICCGDPNNPGADVKNNRTGKNNLSEARARALHNYLVKKGIDKKRIRYIGMAYRYPTGKGDMYDRRVEIEITSVD